MNSYYSSMWQRRHDKLRDVHPIRPSGQPSTPEQSPNYAIVILGFIAAGFAALLVHQDPR